MIISAEIEDGIFYYEANDNIDCNMILNIKLEDIVGQFVIYEDNIKDALDYETIITIIPNCNTEEMESLMTNFDKLYIFYPTILLMLNR